MFVAVEENGGMGKGKVIYDTGKAGDRSFSDL